MNIFLQDIFFLALLIALSIPFGLYIYKVMSGQKVLLTGAFRPVEHAIYKMCGVKQEDEMRPKRYAVSILAFSAVGLVFLFAVQLLQGVLPFNPEGMSGVGAALAFNTAASFVSNTNWQAYAGETTMSYFTQVIGLTVQNFVSAAAGIAVLFVLIRGFVLKSGETVGNFWADLTRIVLYILLPLSVVVAVLLISQGVVQTFAAYQTGVALQDGSSVLVPLGPAASQIAIKQLGTNGGGFFGANSAFPLENPTAFSNFVENFCLLFIPASLCVTFGKAVGDMKQGRVIYVVMAIFFVLATVDITLSEQYLGPVFNGIAASGNMEGKEVIHGIGASSLWAASTTAASNGSVNAMADSFTAIGGILMMFLMQLGEIVFGGVGSGLNSMIAFVILTVFIAGLMVGRTPEYLGKKIEPYDMRMVCVIILIPPLLTIIGTAAATLMPGVSGWLTNTGAHGFSEILYAFTSMANNNGSAFTGYNGNTVFTNVVGGLIMLAVRFVPMTATIFLAGNLARKKTVAAGDGTLSTSNATFAGLLIGVILIVGALAFLPALALGPIADFLS